MGLPYLTLPSNNGYGNFILEPTDTNFFGDTGFYVKDNLDYARRSDLEINSATDYETILHRSEISQEKELNRWLYLQTSILKIITQRVY